ncbi:hypothetical protein Tco_0758684 [Tanacetum coccineum]
MSTLTKVWVECNAIHKREKLKDMEYAKLEAKCNDTLEDLEKKPLVLDLREEITTLQGLKGSEIQLMPQVDGLKHDRVAVVSKVISYIAMELAHNDEMVMYIAQLVKAAIIHGRCSAFEEVASLKEPFDLTKMPSYRPSLKEDDNRAGNELANVMYPFLIEATFDPYALIEVLLFKIPKSLRPSSSTMKFAPS